MQNCFFESHRLRRSATDIKCEMSRGCPGWNTAADNKIGRNLHKTQFVQLDVSLDTSFEMSSNEMKTSCLLRQQIDSTQCKLGCRDKIFHDGAKLKQNCSQLRQSTIEIYVQSISNATKLINFIHSTYRQPFSEYCCRFCKMVHTFMT